MPITAWVAPQLPYLRRYARALTGNWQSGDAYVAALLEALIAEPEMLDRTLEPKVAVFRAFSRIYNSLPINIMATPPAGLAEEEDAGAVADRRLSAIAPVPRQAFLLTALEGLSVEDASAVLDIDEADCSALIDDASREIAEQVATGILIIEDEPIIALDLEALMEGLGHHIVGNARTHTEAVAIARSERPGLVLADIRLADGSSGLDAVNEILQSFDVPVVFITAYPESLLTGERPEPSFLIAKPFREEMVKAVVSQALFFGTAASRIAVES